MKKTITKCSIFVFALFTIFLIENNYKVVNDSIESVEQKPLIQSTNDASMWDGYIRLGMEKLYFGKDDSFEEIVEKIKYSCVKLSCYEDKEETDTNGIGSGFILNITNDKIYIVTAKHVVRHATYGKIKIDYLPEEFNEKTLLMKGIGETSYEQIQKELHTATIAYTSNSCDFAIVVVDISNLDYAYRYDFKEISNFAKTELSINQDLYFFATDRYAKNLKIKNMKTINVEKLEEIYKENYIWSTSGPVNGDSGSLIFDEQGNIVSLIFGVYTGPEGVFSVSVNQKLFLDECKKYLNE